MSNKDYYKILEINRDATQDEIKKAFRKKSLIYHPDKNGTGDDTEFKLINEAYDTLKSDDKRHIYDNPQSNNSNNNFHGFSDDIFENLMRNMNVNMNVNMNANVQNQYIKRQNHNHKINISLRDAHYGLTKTLKLSITKQCFDCKTMCSNCNGNGIIKKIIQTGPFIQQLQCKCHICDGLCIIKNKSNCIKCNNGILNEEQIIKVNIKKNVENGEKIIFKNLGEQAIKKNDEAGDLIIEINIESDPYFERLNDNLIYKTKITLIDTLIGKEIIVPHFDDYFKININTFGIINPNKMYNLKDKGLGNKGNLVFVFEIIYPDNILNDSERNSLKNIFKDVGLLKI